MKEQVSVVVTGTAWMGAGIGSIETALEELFREAEHDIGITVYAISSHTDLLLEWLETALSRGIQVRMVVNRLNNQSSKVLIRLRRFVTVYPHFHLYDFVSDKDYDLHAKLVVIDRKKVLIGSSNLSRRGLVTNYELALLVEGPSAENVAQAMDRLLAAPLVSRVLKPL